MPYNKGDEYEEKIFNILTKKQRIDPNSSRAGAGNNADIQFLHLGQPHNLEVKLDLKADYGQKMLKWSDDKWFWSKDDKVTQLYTSIGILDLLNKKKLKPNRFTIVPKSEITHAHKKEDQQAFEDKINIDIQALYDFYSTKNCYYIQIGGYGFYHLQDDILSLGTTPFHCELSLRLRAKTIHGEPPSNYGFYAVLKVSGSQKPQKSKYDIEEKDGKLFPPLI